MAQILRPAVADKSYGSLGTALGLRSTIEHLVRRRGHRGSLRRQVMLLLSGHQLFMVLVIGALVFCFTARNVRNTWRDRQHEASGFAVGAVSDFLDNSLGYLNLVGLLDYPDLPAERGIVSGFVVSQKSLLEIVRLDRDGQVLGSAQRDRPVLSTSLTIPMSNWFLEARRGQVFYSSVQLSKDNQPYLILAIPVNDGGVVAGRLRFDMLWDVVDAIQFGRSGHAYVITNEGEIVAHPHREYALMRMTLKGRPELSAVQSAPDHRWDGSYINLEGIRVRGTMTRIPGTQWLVVTELAEKEAEELTRTALLVLNGGILAIGCIVLGMANYVLRNYVLEPIETLRRGAERIGQGDWDVHVQGEYRNEVGQVADAFNEMVERLRERDGQLAVQNAALAAEVAERQRAQEALSQSEERYRHLVENQGEGVSILDTEGRFTFVNPAGEGIFGVAPGTLVGQDLSEFVGRDQLAIALAHVDCQPGECTAYELQIVRPDGDSRHILVTATPQYGSDGQFSGVLGIFRDITDRKRAEQELRKAHDELELRVRERTADLAMTNKALQAEIDEHARAEEQVRASLREKEVLLKEIHHRVKNNLQIISSLLSLQASDIDDEQVHAKFAESEHRVRSMALIHEKLYRSTDLARINFREYAKDLLSYLRRSYSDGRVQVSLDADEVMLTVEAAVPCGLMLNELVSNSFKHAFPGDREGTISVSIHEIGDDRTQICVADDGVGLPAGVNVTETSSLGMRLVSMLSEQLEGRLTVDGEGGARFTIVFPRQLASG